MRARASLFALAMLATAPIRIVTAAERYETIVIAPPSEEAGEAGLPASELRQAPGAQGDAGKAQVRGAKTAVAHSQDGFCLQHNAVMVLSTEEG